MAATVSFGTRTTPERKKFFDEVLNRIPDIYPDVTRKDEALAKVFDVFLETYQDTETEDRPTEIKRVKDIVRCGYLTFETIQGGYVCNEQYYKKKKVDLIGSKPDLVIQRCTLCKQGKEDERQRKIETFLQKDSTKKILELRKMLLSYIGEGFEVEVFLCKGDWIKRNSLLGSADGIHLLCPMREDEIVNIHTVCEVTINEKTTKPPCRHLINLLPKARIQEVEDVMKEFVSELPALQAPFEEPEEVPKFEEAEIIHKEEDSKEDEEK